MTTATGKGTVVDFRGCPTDARGGAAHLAEVLDMLERAETELVAAEQLTAGHLNHEVAHSVSNGWYAVVRAIGDTESVLKRLGCEIRKVER